MASSPEDQQEAMSPRPSSTGSPVTSGVGGTASGSVSRSAIVSSSNQSPAAAVVER